MKLNIKPFTFLKKTSFIVLVILVTSCTNSAKKATAQKKNTPSMKTFEWLPSESAPKHYHMSIYKGHFITDSGQYISIPSGGTIKNGWGEFGSTWVIGSDLKPVPSKLAIIYISYTENQFYYGEFDLPKNKITALFEQGYVNEKGKAENYDTLSVGLAPGGAVSVWIKGAGSTVEVAHYQATKTEVDMVDFKPSAVLSLDKYVENRLNEMPEETKAVLKTEGVPIGKWTNIYRKRFSWKPVFKHQDEGTLIDILNDFYNGEFYLVRQDSPLVTTYQNFPPSRRIFFGWYDKNSVEYGAKVYFNETEIWDAFKKIYANEKTTQAELVLEIDKYNSNLKISLQSENDTIGIEKSKIVIYEASK